MNADGGLQINEIGAILRRRAKVVAATALGVILAVYWIAMALPNSYTSYATVLVEPQAVAEDLVKAGVAESDLNQRLHLMTAQILSRPRLSRIIDEHGLYKEESEYLLREEIIDLMRERVRVEPVIPELQQSLGGRRAELAINEFRIIFDDYDPIVARDVAQRLANDFIETHIQKRVQVSQKSQEFIQSELDRLATRIRAAEAEIARVKNDNPGRLPEDMVASQRRLERILGDLAVARRSLAEAQSDESFYASQARLHLPNDDASPVRRLELLKLQLAEYESRGFTEKHPDIIKTREEIARLQKTIEQEDAQAQETVALTPLAQQTEAQARRAALKRAAGEEEIARLEEMRAEVIALIAATPTVAEQLDVLKREYEHMFNTFQDFSKRNTEATVQAQLERRQLGEQFRVLEPAFEAPEPTAPNRALIMVLGVVFALMIAGGTGIVLEALDTSAHDARQLQSRLQLPVLASIPRIWLESDRLRQRRRRVRVAFATAGVIVFALVGGAGNYVWVNGLPRFLSAVTTSPQAPAPAPPSAPTAAAEG